MSSLLTELADWIVGRTLNAPEPLALLVLGLVLLVISVNVSGRSTAGAEEPRSASEPRVRTAAPLPSAQGHS